MNRFEYIGRELEKQGKGGDIRRLAQSEDGVKISRMVDAEKLEKAAKSGDSKALHDILTSVLSTDEGKRLAEKIKKMLK